MKVFIVLATIALAHGAKLERNYLPPSHARTSGGSGNLLQTPISGPSNAPSQIANGFSQSGNGFSQNGAGFSQTEAKFSQTGAGFSHAGDFVQAAYGNNGFNNVNGFNNFESRPERPQAALERSANILRQDDSNDGEAFAYAFETENGIYAEESGVASNGVEAQGGYSYTGDDGQVYSIRYTADQNGFVPQGDHIPTPPPVPEEILKALEQNARDEAAGIFDDGLYNEAKYSDNNAVQQYQQNYNSNDDDAVVTNAAFSRNYPTDADTPKGTGSSTGANFGRASTSGVEKAYLPPFTTADSSRVLSSISRLNAPSANRGSFDRTSGLETPYLPPSVADNSRASVVRSFGTRGSVNPTFATQGSNGPTFATQGSNIPVFGARGSTGPSFGVQKTYLPPFASQTGNGLRRQQSFDSKNGYRY